jgi:ankyrin repeat protein
MLAADGDALDARIARFLRALQEDNAPRALTELTAHPELTRYSLHAAAAAADDTVAAFLAADPSSATRAVADAGPEPIIYAAHAGLSTLLGVSEDDRVRTVSLLLAAGASPNAVVQVEQHPDMRIPVLFFACVSNNVPVVTLLLESGAEPNDGESVYHAAELNHRACLEQLLAYGADISGAHTQWGNTPLYFLAGYKESHPRCETATLGMEWLLEHGADPNVPSDVRTRDDGTPGSAETPLHRVAEFGRRAEVARMLVRHGAHIDAMRADEKTAFTLAARTGNVAMAAYLAEIGADTSRLTPSTGCCRCARADEPAARALIAEHPHGRDTSRCDRQALAGHRARDVDSVRLMLNVGWSLTDEGLGHAAALGRVARPCGRRATAARTGRPVNVRDSQYAARRSPGFAVRGSRGPDMTTSISQ